MSPRSKVFRVEQFEEIGIGIYKIRGRVLKPIAKNDVVHVQDADSDEGNSGTFRILEIVMYGNTVSEIGPVYTPELTLKRIAGILPEHADYLWMERTGTE